MAGISVEGEDEVFETSAATLKNECPDVKEYVAIMTEFGERVDGEVQFDEYA